MAVQPQLSIGVITCRRPLAALPLAALVPPLNLHPALPLLAQSHLHALRLLSATCHPLTTCTPRFLHIAGGWIGTREGERGSNHWQAGEGLVLVNTTQSMT